MKQVLAQNLTLPDGTKVAGVDGFAFKDLGDVLGKALDIILPIAGVGLLLMILSAGFTLMTSAGDSKKMQAGTQRLTYGLVGFLVIFAAYWIVQLAGRMFGVEEIRSVFGQ